ncbi:MAG: L,D-transpeptidase [Ignavibacteriales bacterium]
MRTLKAVILSLALLLAIGSIAGAVAGTGVGASTRQVTSPETGAVSRRGEETGGSAKDATVREHAASETPATQESDNAGDAAEDDSELWVEVDQSEQRVFIHQGSKVIRTFVASTGLPDSPTPNGTFRIENRGEWFYSGKYKQGGRYWVSFLNTGEYLFHSVPMDKNRKIIAEEAAKLGQKASHGCIRLSVDDARWFYGKIPVDTRVVVHE